MQLQTVHQLEEEKLQLVLALVLSKLNEMSQVLNDRRKDLIEANKAVWAETPLIRNMDDALNLITISSEIAQHERQFAQANIEIGQLKNMLNSPYFARIDFIEDGESQIEEIYIGRHSLFDGQVFHIYDWRAPISSLYYDHGVGKASFTVPMGAVEGEITLKRQYRIVKGKLDYLFDTELAIDDEILQYELSQASDGRIKTIINTIQKEQNAAIRSSTDRLLVFGPAGSGKTSVGLHRLAYLLYKSRGGRQNDPHFKHAAQLTSAKIRIFSPSPVFASYIEGIIPELGEEDVKTLDFPALLTAHCFGDQFYDPYELMDFLQTSGKKDPRRKWIEVKFSKAFVDYLEDYVKGYRPAIDEDITFQRDSISRDVICPKDKLIKLYQDRTSAGTLSTKTARVIEYVSQAHEEYYSENRKQIAKFFNSLKGGNLSDGAVRHYFDEQKNIVLADMRGRLLPNAKKLYERVLRTLTRKKSEILMGCDMSWAKKIRNQLRWDKPLYEDALVLLYLDILSGRIAKDKQVKHILLDEAQDVNYLQHRILQQLYSSDCHFTILADVNQSLYPEIHLEDERALEGLYSEVQTISLSTSYRSTYEISQFAAGILGRSTTSQFQRHGDKPQIIDTVNPVQTTWEIIDSLPDSYKTVGILLSDIRKSVEFHRELEAYKNLNLMTLIRDRHDSFEPGIMVMAVPFAKGLEFDAVICPEYGELLKGGSKDSYENCFENSSEISSEISSGISSKNNSKLLYLICTRALHKLYLLKGPGA